MSKNQLVGLFHVYRAILEEAGIAPLNPDVHRHLSREEMIGYCRWVLEEKFQPLLHRIGGFQEALRLVGWIQGVMIACGLCTIAEIRKHVVDVNLQSWEQILD